ncbi:helix-turn-helix domain-containing protein [Catalinimonas niigatensis]|uniref:helix-turn-helix domain-containing protein n=1 Tax=Catalinimonas niigatensis TaxID=1397264 RepID=UPI002664FBFC|nr:AraC family transcriptional regulator [Catalinimonas niigatensis]WPP48687.1 AraC family transcriptional regulator [Catalinimonas niigatensis]
MEKIYVKNMVCDRCIQLVKEIFERHHYVVQKIQLGEVSLEKAVSGKDQILIAQALEEEGFQWLDEHKAQIIEQVKTTIIELIHRQENVQLSIKLSALLEHKLHIDYAYISSLFSETESVTIEKYLIAQRIERAKELLAYNELNLNQIAGKLGYSSTSHLSAQFKKVTGMTPSRFKNLSANLRNPLDKI